MTPPINIDGTNENYSNVTIDGQDVTQITIDGQDVLSAIPDTLIENFEDVDASEPGVYQSGQTIADYYSGATSNWSRTTSNVVQGAKAISADGSSAPDGIYSQPGDGLNNYPSEGDTVGWLVYEGGSVRGGPVVAASGNTNGIDGYFYSASGFMQIFRINDGSLTLIEEDATSYLSSGEWGWCEARVPSSSDGSLSLSLYELNTSDLTRGSLLASISTNDSTHVGQGVGWARGSDSGSHVVSDWLRVL